MLYIQLFHRHVHTFFGIDTFDIRIGRSSYLWLKLMHNTINDSKMMHGARGQGLLVEEEKRIKSMIQRRTCFFEADDGFRLKWDLVQVVVLLVTAVVVPLRVGFSALDDKDPKFWFAFDVVSDTYFMVDIVINCRTAYVNDEHKIEADQKKVFVHYLKTWFLIDFLACLPINYILYLTGTLDLPWLANQGPPGRADSGGADSIKVLKVLRLFRLTKMLRVLKLKSIADRLQDSTVYQTFLTSFKLMKLIILLLYLSHFLACFWYLIGTTDENPTPARTRYGWVSRNYNDGTWNDYNGYSPTPLVTRYVTALFHSLTDFGMDFAETDIEMTWISIQHIIYEAFMAYLTGVLAGEVIVGNAAKQKYSEKMGEIREFLQHHNIHRSTRQKVTAFYEHLNDKKTFFDEQEVLNEFPPNIRKQIVEEIYGAHGGRVMQIPFIENLNERLRFELCVLLQPLPARFGDEILTQGDYGDEMYILVSGMCAVFKRDQSAGESGRLARRKQSVSGLNMNEQLRRSLEALGKTEKELGIEFRDKGERVQDLYGGSFFGEEALLHEEVVREATIIALAESQLLYLSRRSLETLRGKDKEEFIGALSRFDELRQRQRKAWVKQTHRFDEHLAKLASPEKVSQLRDIFDRDPTFHEMMKFESVISNEQKKLKAEALEAIYARLCVRELPQGMDATDESRKGINLVLRGELQGVTATPKDTSIALRRSKSAPAGTDVDKGAIVTLAVGSCFSSLELIEEVATPHSHLVKSAVVHSKTATVLWLDEHTWRWTRMRDSQLDVVAAFDGASDDEDEDDHGERKEFVGGQQTEQSSRQRAVVWSDQDGNPSESPPGQPMQRVSADHPTAGKSPRSILAKAPNANASIDELAVKLDAQANEILNLGGRLQRIEGGLEEITTLVRALGAHGNGLGTRAPEFSLKGTQTSTFQPTHGSAVRSTTPPRSMPLPQPEPEPEPKPADSSDASSTDDDDDDHDDNAATLPISKWRHTQSSAARSTTPPRRKLVPQPEPELAPVGAAAAQAIPEASSTDDDDGGDEGAPPIPVGRVSTRRRDGSGNGDGDAPPIPVGRVSARRRLPVSGRK